MVQIRLQPLDRRVITGIMIFTLKFRLASEQIVKFRAVCSTSSVAQLRCIFCFQGLLCFMFQMSGQNNAGNNAPPANQQPPPPGVQQQGLQQPQGVQQGVQQPPPPWVQQFLPPPLFPGQLGAGQQLQGSVHSALWNSHYAFSSARWAVSQALSAAQSCAVCSFGQVYG